MAAVAKSNAKKVEKREQLQIKVNSNGVIGPATQYAQVVTVTVTDSDVMFEFIYINPRHDEKKANGYVVSRVTMPKSDAATIPDLINNVIKKHDAKPSK